MTMAGWDPVGDFASWRRAVNSMFNGAGVSSSAHPQRSLPVNVYELADEYVVQADVPGVGPDDVDVRLEKRRLTIHTNRLGRRGLRRAALDPPGELGRRAVPVAGAARGRRRRQSARLL